MKHLKFTKRQLLLFGVGLMLYFSFFGMGYWVCGEQLEFIKSQTDTVEPIYSDGGLVGGCVTVTAQCRIWCASWLSCW